MNNIKDVFKSESIGFKVDNNLLKGINGYLQAFIHKNPDYTAFFGGNLTGVHMVRFTPDDMIRWFDEVIEMDDTGIESGVKSLPHIDPNHKRATDPMNLSCIWLLHMIHNTEGLSSKKKHAAMIDVLLILQSKFLTSLMAWNYKYPADRATAEATYAALTKKFSLKVHGSWQALLYARAEDIIDSKSIHNNTIRLFNDDDAIIYMITDIQGRLREVVKNINKVFYQIREQDAKTLRVSGVMNLDGEKIVRDRERNTSQYIGYIKLTIPNKQSFIRHELVQVVGDIMHTMPDHYFKDALEYISDNFGVKGGGKIEELVEETLLHAFDFLSRNKDTIKQNDIGAMIIRLRAVYMSSRSTDPVMLKMRDLAEGLVDKAVKSRNSSVIASVRTGILLYLVLRTFTMQHYS